MYLKIERPRGPTSPRPKVKCHEGLSLTALGGFPQTVRVELIGDDRAQGFGLFAIGSAPLCALCRKLIRAGIKADLPVEAYRGAILALRASSLLAAAQLTVEDGRDGRPRFRRHRARVWASPPKTAPNGSGAPRPLPAENNASWARPAKASAAETLRAVVASALDRLANEPHDTIPGLCRRYYYRGAFVLLEHLSERGLEANVKRLHQRGEHEHADKLATSWRACAEGAP
jgi:hypothetical protein